MPNVKHNAAAQETCRKLIDAAGQVFADRGLHAATIKEITDRAGVNVAAVNYHFSDKFELYAAVIRHALTLTRVGPTSEQLRGTPEDRLRQVIRSYVEDLFDPSRPAWRGPLLAHEFAQPTAALDAVTEELLRPRSELIRGIVRDILGPGVSEKKVLATTYSVVGQVVFYLYHTEFMPSPASRSDCRRFRGGLGKPYRGVLAVGFARHARQAKSQAKSPVGSPEGM